MRPNKDKMAIMRAGAIDAEFAEHKDVLETENNESDNLDKKIDGAVDETSKRATRDKTVEDNLSVGLDNPEFEAAAGKIDKKRNKFIAGLKNILGFKKRSLKKDLISDSNDISTSNSEVPPFVLDDEYRQSMIELEKEMADSFSREVYSRLAEMNKVLLLDHLVDNPASQEKSEIINIGFASEGNYNVVAFSDNGYLMQLTNKEEVTTEDSINIKDDKAQYNVIAPDGTVLAEKINYTTALEGIDILANEYHKVVVKEFEELKNEQPENTPENNAENVPGQEPENGESVSEQTDNNEEAPENNLPTLENVDNREAKDDFANPFNENISVYAKSIGIEIKELATNKNFVELLPEQQQFVLETLRRSSLAKAKVEGHQSFIQEKDSKKIWQIGFSLNQNYHKERHKIEALKNIESQGLAGYGEDELDWLIDVIKSGPEVKINEAGEVIVNCLPESNFGEEQTELVSRYNETAREYIEVSKNKNNKVEIELQKKLDDLKIELLNSAEDDNKAAEINNLLFKSKSNIELLRFLSADKETEKLLDRMSVTSFNGLDKVKSMVGAQKDKAGYAALGFTLRTGTKFALANSACLASAISYGVGPMAAAIVGGFRGHNQGKKELIEREELARLGIKDQSKTARDLNLATGEKNGVNFGLTEKLQRLIDELNSEVDEDKIEKIKRELNLRIDYTENKINNESIDYGSIDERNINYFNLINTVAEAKSAVGKSVVYSQINKYWNVDENVKKRTRGKGGKEDFEKISNISAYDRLASFMNYREEKQHKKELNFLVKKTATGAIMGATFAAAGAFVAEKLGVSEWLSEHLNKESFRKLGDNLESLIPGKRGVPQEVVNNLVETKNVDTNIAIKENVSNVKQDVVMPKTEVTPETPKAIKFVDEISNKDLNGKSDSVWRSTREIFKNNARELGYKGDLNDQSALNNWAETQTANTINSSGELNDKVFEGNKVVLIKDGDGFKAVVEQGGGAKPGQLSEDIETIKIRNNNPALTPIEDIDSGNSEIETYEFPKDLIAQDSSYIDVENNRQLVLDYFRFKSEDLHQQGSNLVYEKDFGKVIFSDNNRDGKLEIAFVDKNGAIIPDSFVEEIKGKKSVENFINKDLDKTFKSWNKLDINDRRLYQVLNDKTTKDELLNQIKIQFNLNNDIRLAANNHLSVQTGLNKQEYFSLDFKGVKKMLKFLAKIS